MKSIYFTKYTSYGNNFVIIDECHAKELTEAGKSQFAFQATNVNFGIGADNFLVIQPFTNKVLDEINTHRAYWKGKNFQASADYIFRMFEPAGTEALCCANGLMCIAQHLYHVHGLHAAKILAEIPTHSPTVISIGTDPQNYQINWVNLGHPRKTPSDLVTEKAIRPFDECVDIVDNMIIRLRKHDLAPFSKKKQLNLKGYLVFTGEPHLVIFPEQEKSKENIIELMFASSFGQNETPGNRIENRLAFGTWLVNRIGTALNSQYRHFFPRGINVNFVNNPNHGLSLEYRTFERGINKETMSCGTGALACAFVVSRLNNKIPISMLPQRCRSCCPEAKIGILKNDSGWILKGSPVKLFTGHFLKHSVESEAAIDTKMHVLNDGQYNSTGANSIF